MVLLLFTIFFKFELRLVQMDLGWVTLFLAEPSLGSFRWMSWIGPNKFTLEHHVPTINHCDLSPSIKPIWLIKKCIWPYRGSFLLFKYSQAFSNFPDSCSAPIYLVSQFAASQQNKPRRLGRGWLKCKSQPPRLDLTVFRRSAILFRIISLCGHRLEPCGNPKRHFYLFGPKH